MKKARSHEENGGCEGGRGTMRREWNEDLKNMQRKYIKKRKKREHEETKKRRREWRL